MEMNEQRGVRVGDVSGQVVVGDHNTVTSGEAPLNLTELLRFAQAVAEALPALRLDPVRQEEAQALATEILAADGPEPDRRRLRQAGRTLRTIVEGAAANALASGLLGIWP
jgi:hypothetical protein